MTRSSTPRRAATATLSYSLTAIVALAPLPALADGSIADAAFQLRSPLTPMTTGMKLRGYVSLQDPEAGGEVAPAPEGDPAAAPPPAGAPAPYPYPPPPGYGPPPPPQPPPRGLGMLISGAVITGAVALPSLIFGAYTIAVFRAAADQTDPNTGDVVRAGGNIAGGFFIVFGILALGAGVPLLAIGGSRMSKYNKWKASQPQQARLLPHSGRTAHGTWTTGFTLRF